MTFSPTPAAEKGQVTHLQRQRRADEPLRLGVPARAPRRIRPPARRQHVSRARRRPARSAARRSRVSGKPAAVVRHRAGRPQPRPMVGHPEVRRSRGRDEHRSRPPDVHEIGERRRRTSDSSTARATGRSPFIRRRRSSRRAGPFFNEDDQVDFDIVNYDIDASFDPRREWIDGKATRAGDRAPRSDFVARADARRAADRAFGHERAPWVSDGAARQRTGRHHHQPAGAAAARTSCSISNSCTAGGCRQFRPSAKRWTEGLQANDFFNVQALPSYIYTGRSGWYPRATSPITRRRRCGCACPKGIRRSRAGRSTRGIRRRCRPQGRTAWMEYRFSATQPVRYLGWATSRFVHVDSASFSIPPTEGDDAPLTGASYTFGEI